MNDEFQNGVVQANVGNGDAIFLNEREGSTIAACEAITNDESAFRRLTHELDDRLELCILESLEIECAIFFENGSDGDV